MGIVNRAGIDCALPSVKCAHSAGHNSCRVHSFVRSENITKAWKGSLKIERKRDVFFFCRNTSTIFRAMIDRRIFFWHLKCASAGVIIFAEEQFSHNYARRRWIFKRINIYKIGNWSDIRQECAVRDDEMPERSNKFELISSNIKMNVKRKSRHLVAPPDMGLTDGSRGRERDNPLTIFFHSTLLSYY